MAAETAAIPAAAVATAPTLTFEEHDGSLVPVLRGGEQARALVSVLQSTGLEVLFPEDGVYILYTKEYTDEEQTRQDAGHGLHRGHSIATLFRDHPQLRQYVDAASLEAKAPFLDTETLASVRKQQGNGKRKWENFWAKDEPPPWESDCPYEILTRALEGDEALQALAAKALSGSIEAIELGCGSGHNSVFLAEKGFRVVGVDIVADALVKARSLAESKLGAVAGRVTWAQLDVFKLLDDVPVEQLPGGRALGSRFDLILDFQCFHVLRPLGEEKLVEVLAGLLRPGGLLLIVTGNADEPEDRGPVRLRREELEKAFAGSSLEFLWLRAERMTATPAYAKSGSQPPLAWAGLLRKTGD